MPATLIRERHGSATPADGAGVGVLLTGVLPEGPSIRFASAWAARSGQRLLLIESGPDAEASDAPDGSGVHPAHARRPQVRTRRIARMVAELHPDVPQSVHVLPGAGADALASVPRQVSCLVAANPFPARPDLWRPIAAPECPLVLVPADAVTPDSRASVLLLLDRAEADVSTVAFAFAYAHRVGRSLRALIVGDGPEPPAVLRTLGLVAGCYPRVQFDSIGRPECDVAGFAALASDAALVVAGVTPGRTPRVACGWDLAEVVAAVGRPIALLDTTAERSH